MKRNASLLACLLFTSAVNAASFELDGFKQAKFGAGVGSLEAQGYKCGAGPRLECKSDDTLFGMQASVRAWFLLGKVNSVRVLALDDKPIDLVASYTAVLGKPQEFVERNWQGKEVHVFYWISKAGTSIVTFANNDDAIRNPDTGHSRYFAAADYLDKDGTAALLQRRKDAQRAKRDF